MSESEDSDDDGSILMVSERTTMKDLMFEDAGCGGGGGGGDVSRDVRSLNNLVISSACTLDDCTVDKTNTCWNARIANG